MLFRFIRFPWCYRAADTGAGTGGDGTEPATDAGLPQTADTTPKTVSMSQEDFDKLIADRVRRAEAKGKKDAADEAKRLADQAAMTDAEKLKQQADDAVKTAADASAKANARIVQAEAKAVAAVLGVKPERIAAALKLADLSAVEVGDDGNPDEVAIKTAIEAVIADIPELVGTVTNRNADASARGNTPGKIDPKTMSNEDFKKLQARVLAGERIEL